MGLTVVLDQRTCKSWETWYVLVRAGTDLGFSCTFIGAAWEAEGICSLSLLYSIAVMQHSPKQLLQMDIVL